MTRNSFQATSDVIVDVSGVWKKFCRGGVHNALRDLIPSMAKRLLGGGNQAGELRSDQFWALRDISFKLKRGETLGIIGPNGAGKSTMLKILSRIVKPNRGHVRVHGRLAALIEVSAGFHPDLTGRENIYLNAAILGMKKAEVDGKLDEIVAFSGLDDFLDTPVKRYSSGMYARLGFSIAAHVDPEILLIDEVLSVGDITFQQKCMDRIQSVAKNGTTIIFISHNLQSVQTLCPQTLYLRGGQMVQLGATLDVIKEYVGAAKGMEPLPHTPVIIDQVVLCDERGAPAHSFGPGETAELRLTVKSREPLGECLLGFLVHRATDGLPICDYNLPLVEVGKQAEGNGKEIRLSIKFDTNLLRGLYVCSLHVLHHRRATFLCRVNAIATFSVEERISWQGVSHLNPRLETLNPVCRKPRADGTMKTSY